MSTADTPPAVPSSENYSDKPKATPVDRILAGLIDGFLCAAVGWVPILGWIACIGYSFTKDALPFLGGQSVGKKVMKIRAVTEDGAPLTGNFGAAAMRAVPFLIPCFGFVELFMLLTDKETLRFGDKWAKTKVVKVG